MASNKKVKVVYNSNRGVFKHYMSVSEYQTDTEIKEKAYNEITSERNENVTIISVEDVESAAHESVIV
jgi:hypothetical protein